MKRETNRNMTSSVRKASLKDAEQITALINRAFRRAEGFFIETNRIDLESVQDLFKTGQFLLAESEGLGACRFMDIQVVNLREDLFGFYHRRGYVETGARPFPAEVETKMPVHFVEMTKRLGPYGIPI